jgi:hypothetical protein
MMTYKKKTLAKRKKKYKARFQNNPMLKNKIKLHIFFFKVEKLYNKEYKIKVEIN